MLNAAVKWLQLAVPTNQNKLTRALFNLSRMKNSTSVSSTIRANLVNATKRDLEKDVESDEKYPNRDTRRVSSGHYVETKPEPLKQPFMIAYSADMLRNLSLSEEDLEHPVNLEEFTSIFSGKNDSLDTKAWATPYAVSVNAHPILAPDHFQGDAYGDGRAMTLFHVATPTACLESTEQPAVTHAATETEYEVQLKGAGRTPFSRNFDGRAVLRSSIREFLVSELMHALGVRTTRALCLVSSADESDVVHRAWYENMPMEDTDSTFQYPPSHMVAERCAITTRASSSFFRIGHLELYSRRMKLGDPQGKRQLVALLKHVWKRHYPHLITDGKDLAASMTYPVFIPSTFDCCLDSSTDPVNLPSLLRFLEEFSERQAHLISDWQRVGFVQGNMNSDNILLDGCTLDYGPFGFMGKFDPSWNPFTSDPQKNYGFSNQPRAGQLNLATLFDALLPLIEESGDKAKVDEAINIVRSVYVKAYVSSRSDSRRRKLGLADYEIGYDESLFKPLLGLLVHFDYTMFWRVLSSAKEYHLKNTLALSDNELVQPLRKACCSDFLHEENPVVDSNVTTVAKWLRQWLAVCSEQSKHHGITLPDRELMLRTNPKYVAKEWMLVEAYEDAMKADIDSAAFDQLLMKLEPSLGSPCSKVPIERLWCNQNDKHETILFGKIYALQRLFSEPYAEHCKEVEALFFKPTPEKYRNKPGIAFYSCSS